MRFNILARWARSRLPKGLYGRAILIFFLPIAILQLAISFDFAQRYFTDVTEQFSDNAALDLRLISALYQRGDMGLAHEFSQELNIDLATVSFDEIPQSSGRRFYDISGLRVTKVFESEFTNLERIWFGEPQRVSVYFSYDSRVLRLSFSRRHVSPSNPHQFLIATFLIAALMIGIAGLFLRNQLKPITTLAQAAEQFGRGNIVPYRVRGATEVRAAGRAFLQMRSRIESHLQQRTQMLSGISHDLRTPLTRLRLEAELLDEPHASHIAADVETMDNMINSFLTFARNDSKLYEREHVNLKLLLTELAHTNQRGGYQVSLALPEDNITAWASPLLVERAVQNLITNANHYGEMVRVTLIDEQRQVLIVVEDDGPGIAEDQREAALQPFTRLDPARNQDKGGSVGLGLTIIADIAGAHGGSLLLDRSEMFGGLKATLTLSK